MTLLNLFMLAINVLKLPMEMAIDSRGTLRGDFDGRISWI